VAERPVRIGITLPGFVDDPEVVVAAARAAEGAGLDGVFAWDHLFRVGAGGTRRPSLSLEAVLGMVAADTSSVALGSFVARATVRHAAVLATVFDTVHRIAPGRLLAGIGSGDSESDSERAMFGLPEDDVTSRLAAIEVALDAVTGRGFPVWVGGRSAPVVAAAAARADAWNGWGLAAEGFARGVRALRKAERAAGRPEGTVGATWGGLVELRPDHWDVAASRSDVLGGGFDLIAEHLGALAEVGAAWVILAPVDPTDPENATVVAREIASRLG